ncbi:Rv3654c family TadE-like protein [Streptomyces sp. enrichment culture]|uniref:Rv3654c family TadE-like protein n=1 Tax=Streptomyces sp. enrichment culture TaxID=1795815 RepID=UPI003F578297
MKAHGGDRGSATVWSLGAIAVLCAVFGIVLALGQAVVVRHHAARGADMAALAAADHWPKGGAAACEHADRVARAQGVRLVRCVLDGEISDVTAASSRGPFTLESRARAGPAGVDPVGVLGRGPTDPPGRSVQGPSFQGPPSSGPPRPPRPASPAEPPAAAP